jgi:hypothetical protein
MIHEAPSPGGENLKEASNLLTSRSTLRVRGVKYSRLSRPNS